MMTLIDRVSILADQIVEAYKAGEFGEGLDKAHELLGLVGQLDDYELAKELEDLAVNYIKQWGCLK